MELLLKFYKRMADEQSYMAWELVFDNIAQKENLERSHVLEVLRSVTKYIYRIFVK